MGLGKGKEFDVMQRLKLEYERKYHYSLGTGKPALPSSMESAGKVRTRRQLMHEFLACKQIKKEESPEKILQELEEELLSSISESSMIEEGAPSIAYSCAS